MSYMNERERLIALAEKFGAYTRSIDDETAHYDIEVCFSPEELAAFAAAVASTPSAFPVEGAAQVEAVALEHGIPHSLGGLRGAYIGEHGRTPTEQEIWDGAIRSYRDLAPPAFSPKGAPNHE